MKVAPGGITEAHWRSLDLASDSSPDWAAAIMIFQKRLQERFIEPVDTLIDSEMFLPRERRKYGFSVLAIDCLVIETLQAFRCGEINTDRKSRLLITHFLMRNPHFIWAKDVAHRFYEDVRCGILHQAETKRDSLVRSEGPLLIDEPNGLIVNRTAFHSRLKDAFSDYVTSLKNNHPRKLRGNFLVKMNHICRDNPLATSYPIA